MDSTIPPGALPAVLLQHLHKTFQPRGHSPVEAVTGIDLSINAGEVVAVLGPNGAGKTTTIDMLLGLSSPTSGEVRLFGLPPREAIATGRVSAVLQSGGLLRDLTVRETVRIIASTFAHHIGVDTAIERAGLMGIAQRKVAKCSGGEQQRLRFALALLPDPDLLVLDEPTAGMDVSARRDFWSILRAEAATGLTVLFATHYLAEASDFADRIVVVAHGQIVADDSTEHIRATTADRTVSAIVENPANAAEALARLDHVSSAVLSDGRLVVRTHDSDDVAKTLMTEWHARDLLIANADLEEAFVALTQNPGKPS